MGQQWLANLALIHIHLSLEEVVDKYAWFHPGQIALDSLIKS